MIFLDTSTAIQILNGKDTLEDIINKFDKGKFGITSPSVFELYHGIYKLKFLKKKISEKEYKKLIDDLEYFLSQLNIFSLNEKSANLAAKLHMDLKGKGQEIEIFDCLIAAVILSSGFNEIITNNKDHFKRIEGLTLYSF